MPIRPPVARNWWALPVGREEKIWLTIVVAVGVGMFLMMPLWHAFGAQNSPTQTYRVAPDAYWQKVTAFTDGTSGISARTNDGVKPTADDVYLGAMQWAWQPNQTILEAGRPYRIHVSSKDVNHGFSLHKVDEAAQKVNFQVVPGYEYVLTMTFDQPGTYEIVCQEYCGLAHQFMVGKIVVVKGGQ
jgi:cytochrome c oxidase subunit 2